LPAKPKEPTADVEKPSDPLEQVQNELKRLGKQKEESDKKAAEYLDRLQRLQADMENLQKITKRQLDAVTKQASERLLVELLPIVDALQQAGNIAHSGNSMPPEEIAVGLRMLREQLAEVLQSEGMEEIPAVGQPLDPERHEVVSYLETDDAPENTVMEEIRKGYILNGKVIRPSLVVVSRPKASKEKQVEGNGA
jgi:molecular chaperone GrpE